MNYKKRQISPTYLLLFIFITISVLMASCDTNEGEPVYMGHEYFGFDQGKWLIYEVDSTVYDDFLGEVFHYSYQVMVWNKELFEDSRGDQIMRKERFYRADNQQPWQIKNVWTSSLLTTRALNTEENVTFVKLAFPLKGNMTWDGNIYNTGQTQNYRITKIHEPFEQGSFLFDSTLTVLQKDFSTLIGDEFQYEQYATGIGLIKKKFIALEKEIDGTIIRGVDYSYTLIEVGFDE